MSVYVDTSAILAVLNADDANHEPAKKTWIDLLRARETLVTSNYVLVEAFALVQHRLGNQAVRTLQEDIVPVLAVEWVGKELHQQAVSSLLTANRRSLSLVDCASFAVMRHLGLKRAFTFDGHFSQQGFECLP